MAPALRPERGSHSSGAALTRNLVQPTRTTGLKTGRSACAIRVVPIRFCSRWGLPCHPCCHACGGLLPHPFTLTCRKDRRFAFCGTFPRVAPAGRYPAPCFHGARTFLPRSLSALAERGCPANWQAVHKRGSAQLPEAIARKTGRDAFQRVQTAKSVAYSGASSAPSRSRDAPRRPISSELLAAAPLPPVSAAMRPSPTKPI